MSSNTHESSPPTPIESRGLFSAWDMGGTGQLPVVLFLDQALKRGLRHIVRQQVAAPELKSNAVRELGRLEVHYVWGGAENWVIDTDDAMVWIDSSPGAGAAEIAAASTEEAEEVRRRVIDVLGAWTAPEDEIAMTFWAHGCDGARSSRRRITAPAWRDVQRSYDSEVAGGMRQLLGARESAAGRLILWHGPPGTGKTHALRALVRGWRDWCIPQFVTDPDALLGRESAYMMQVLTAGDWEPGKNRRWTLVILEDAGELLAIDARRETGQALSRLLNITDGLIGQGTNALVLVTTNEPLSTLHPAVARPGRCWMEMEFGPLTARQANRWLRTHGADGRVAAPTVLADLYALLNGRSGDGPEPALSSGHRAIGFARALSEGA